MSIRKHIKNLKREIRKLFKIQTFEYELIMLLDLIYMFIDDIYQHKTVGLVVTLDSFLHSLDLTLFF